MSEFSKWARSAIDEILATNGAPMHWHELQKSLVHRYWDRFEGRPHSSGSAKDIDVSYRVLAEVPESYISRVDAMVRQPDMISPPEIGGERCVDLCDANSASFKAWASVAIDQALEKKKGTMHVQELKDMLVEQFHQSLESNSSSKPDADHVGLCVLASIPGGYLSHRDAFVRLSSEKRKSLASLGKWARPRRRRRFISLRASCFSQKGAKVAPCSQLATSKKSRCSPPSMRAVSRAGSSTKAPPDSEADEKVCQRDAVSSALIDSSNTSQTERTTTFAKAEAEALVSRQTEDGAAPAQGNCARPIRARGQTPKSTVRAKSSASYAAKLHAKAKLQIRRAFGPDVLEACVHVVDTSVGALSEPRGEARQDLSTRRAQRPVKRRLSKISVFDVATSTRSVFHRRRRTPQQNMDIELTASSTIDLHAKEIGQAPQEKPGIQKMWSSDDKEAFATPDIDADKTARVGCHGVACVPKFIGGKFVYVNPAKRSASNQSDLSPSYRCRSGGA